MYSTYAGKRSPLSGIPHFILGNRFIVNDNDDGAYNTCHSSHLNDVTHLIADCGRSHGVLRQVGISELVEYSDDVVHLGQCII